MAEPLQLLVQCTVCSVVGRDHCVYLIHSRDDSSLSTCCFASLVCCSIANDGLELLMCSVQFSRLKMAVIAGTMKKIFGYDAHHLCQPPELSLEKFHSPSTSPPIYSSGQFCLSQSLVKSGFLVYLSITKGWLTGNDM